ncbi:putative bifunctional diguanylate cyclase/phosphodiesterase [Fundidesulfovibrio terrae]|uniref:putative bifunctional diguanylate cyclase/phosphodiesterase n=1 Tax=Fundidesulfovibrio terrae TaxID=2922866 RepID=UPI001FAE9428|nr:EAL domain-containing protein [Fundidesulfovibrio terrae]
MKRSFGIAGRLTAALFVIALVSQLMSFHSSKHLREAAIKQREVDKVNTISQLIMPHIKGERERTELVTQMLLMHQGLSDEMLRGGMGRREAVARIIDAVFQESMVDLLEVTDNAGVVLYRAQEPGRSGDVSLVWGVEEALTGRSSIVSTSEPGGAWIISVKPVQTDGRVVGTVLVGMQIGDRFMRALGSEVGAKLALLSRSGEVVASSAPGGLKPEVPVISEAFLQKIPIYRTNETMHTSLVYLPVLIVDEAWVIMAEVDSSAAFSLLEEGDWQSMLFMSLVAGGSMLVTFVFLRYALKPLRDLRLRAEKDVARLDGTASSCRAGDEIVSVVHVLDTLTTLLTDRNQELTEQKVKLEFEIGRSQAAAAEINQLAFYDTLTALPNRRLLFVLLEKELAACSRHRRVGALLFIDLDNFKSLNDTLGHDKGDSLLKHAAQRLAACVREEDVVSRLGGDEFVVMLKDLSENPQSAANKAEKVGEKILAALNHTFRISNHEHHSTASIGVTLFAGGLGTADELLKQADLAMYQAKAAGHNTIRFFHPEMQARITARAAMEADLREGIAAGQFFVCYQGQVGEGARLLGAEALMRWRHPRRGMVSPAEFIPLAEDTGLILPLGKMVLETACGQLRQWASRPEMADLTLAVNISARQFQQHDFVDQVMDVLERTGANPHRLKLELTESLVLHNVEDIIAKMVALKSRGIGFSLDDFGTGYSSLSYLKLLPLDQLKIDRTFISDILTNPCDAAIAKIVIALADTLGLAVIAEGVESEAQRLCLARLGCKAYQGYLFSHPLPLEEFEEYARVTGRILSAESVPEDRPRGQERTWSSGHEPPGAGFPALSEA